jgi:DNA-binding transcriptional LysR family regulator
LEGGEIIVASVYSVTLGVLPPVADVLDHACSQAGFQLRVAVRTEQTAAAPVLAAAGSGPALLPANLVPPGFTGGVHRTDPPVSRALTAYTRPSPDPLTTAFVNMLAMPG